MGAAAGAGTGAAPDGRSPGTDRIDGGSGGAGVGGASLAAPGGIGAGGSGSGGKVVVVVGRAGVGGSILPVAVCTSPAGGKLLDVDPDAGGVFVIWPNRGASGDAGAGGSGAGSGPEDIRLPAGCTPVEPIPPEVGGSAGFMPVPAIDGAGAVGRPAVVAPPVPVADLPTVGAVFQPFDDGAAFDAAPDPKDGCCL
jgi:hypothetical protein